MPEKLPHGKYPLPSRVSNPVSGVRTPSGATRSSRALRWSAVLATGLALGAATPPYSLYPLGWIALVPLLVRWTAVSDGRRAWLEASAAYLAYYLLAGWWGWNHLLLEPALSASAPLLLLPLLLGAPWGLGVRIRRRWGRAAGVLVVAGGSLFLEWMLHRGPFALPWLLLGHTQAEAFPFNQLAAPLGVLGLSAWVWGTNLTAWLSWREVPERTGRAALFLLALLLGGAWMYGSARMDGLTARETTDPDGALLRTGAADSVGAGLRVALIQSGLEADTWVRGGSARIELLLHLSDSVLARAARGRGPRPELVLWPEAALPRRHAAPGDSLRRRLTRWARRRDVHLLTGATVSVDAGRANAGARRTVGEHGVGAGYNAALLFGPNGRTLRYEKRRLVPFAERVPLSGLWAPLSRLALDAGGRFRYLRGEGPPVLRTGPIGEADRELRLGVLICFESLFGGLARTAREEGADVLAVLAQDGWWGRTPGYRQHFAFTRLRAIETGLPVLMVTVNGRSGIIRPDGRAPRTVGWNERTVLEATLPLAR